MEGWAASMRCSPSWLGDLLYGLKNEQVVCYCDVQSSLNDEPVPGSKATHSR